MSSLGFPIKRVFDGAYHEVDDYRARNRSRSPRNTPVRSQTTAASLGTPLADEDQPPTDPKREKKEKKKEKKKPSVPQEPMIVVNVNDRLGTKAAIPCLGSDTVGDFKAIVAAHIGRQRHEIMLKRQGERPFKDNISLADYGVSNGVQLDLELDTGD